jgi:integrase
LTDDEAASLLACGGAHLTPLVMTALHTGFWASALLSLTWQGVDFRRGVIMVQAGYAKNGEAHSVPMNNTLTMLLKSAKVDDAAAERVFGGRASTPYRSYRNAFEHAVQAAVIEACTCHDLCRTFANRLVMAGLDLPTVTELGIRTSA